jgi:hypothetical protein
MLIVLVFIAFCSSLAHAQIGLTPAADQDDYPKLEGYVGFSHLRVTAGSAGFNGFEAAATANVSRWVGLKVDLSGNYRSDFGTRASIYNFVGGVQLRNNSDGTRFKPFAHALLGGAHISVSGGDFSETGLSAVVGIGMDIRATDRIDVRVLQADYNLNRFSGTNNHHYRLGAGIVFH